MAKDELFSGESKNIEYKVVVPDKSEKYMKTVVAFANTQGGRKAPIFVWLVLPDMRIRKR